MFGMFPILASLWPLLALIAVGGIFILILSIFKGKDSHEEEPIVADSKKPLDLSFFSKKPFVFDSKSELELYNLLRDVLKDKYLVFPQIGYGHLIKAEGENDFMRRAHRRNYDSRTADFVICDVQYAVAKLVIELDGPSHSLPDKRGRDIKIDSIMSHIGLPLLHLSLDEGKNRLVLEEKLRPYLAF